MIKNTSNRTKSVIFKSKKLSAFFANMLNGFAYNKIILDANGKPVDTIIIEANKAYEKICGMPRSEFIGKRTSTTFPYPAPNEEEAASRIAFLEKFAKVALEGITINTEYHFTEINKWLHITAYSPKKFYYVSIFEDITEHKKLEEKLSEYTKDLEKLFEERTRQLKKSERLARELNDSQKKYQALIETAHDFIWETDAQGNYTYCSPKTMNIWGIKPEDMIGKNSLESIPEPQRRELMKLFGSTKPLIGVEAPSYDGKGRLVLVEANAAPFFDEKGELLGWRGISRDITERKELEKKLSDHTKNLEKLVEERTKQLQESERLAAIGQTAGMIGHDIRNPLQAIINELYLAKKRINNEANIHEKKEIIDLMNLIQEQTNYISKIVADLQDYSRQIKPEISEVNLLKIVSSVIQTVQLNEKMKTSVNIAKGVKLETDAVLFKRILTNLVNNSIQAMPEGGKLEISANKKEKWIIIKVSDTGEGIPQDIKPKIFKPLFTTKAKGQGFGLAVVKRLVEALNGTVTFESQKGKGTTFTLVFPSSEKQISKRP